MPCSERCLFCGSEVETHVSGLFDTRFGIDAIFSVVGCRRCSLEQTRPLPSANELVKLYEGYYNFSGEIGTRYTTWRARILTSTPYRSWLAVDGDISFSLHKGTGRLLD